MSWIKRIRKRISKKLYPCMTAYKYARILSALKQKIKKGEKIRIGFYVVFDSVFPAEQIFQMFLKDKMFDPFILVIPDVSRGEENMFYQLDKTYKTLSSKYKNVYMSYDKKEKAFIDFLDKVDMVFFANPYDPMTHEYYRIERVSDQNKLTLYTHYGYLLSNATQHIFTGHTFSKLWKVFLLSRHEQKLLEKNEFSGKNGILMGYCKLDGLADIKPKKRTRKKIIISPHHTVKEWKNGLELSNFLRYSDFFIKLFKKYPKIDFVFRPHPLLWINLENNNIWTKKQIDKYIKDITSLPNVEFQNGGEYLETFVNSDALIHDCSSFSAEYLFVNKPCCFLLKDQEKLDQNSNAFHKECIKQHYPAYNEQEIIDFIENVVIKNKDLLREKRQAFVQKELLFEYPNVSTKMYEYIKKEIGI